MDIAGLTRLTSDTIVMIVMALGFMVGFVNLPNNNNSSRRSLPQTFGFATEEFEVTPDRLGVYLPVVSLEASRSFWSSEIIFHSRNTSIIRSPYPNPFHFIQIRWSLIILTLGRGYAEKEGDARRFHPSLRPPVNPRELDIDERTGMKVSSPGIAILSDAWFEIAIIEIHRQRERTVGHLHGPHPTYNTFMCELWSSCKWKRRH